MLPSGPDHADRRDRHVDGPLEEAYPPLSVTLRLEDEIDVSRGDMICRPHNQPTPPATSTRWSAGCPRPLRRRARYRIKHTTRTALAKVDECATVSTSTRCTATSADGSG